MIIDEIGAVLVLYNEDYKSCATIVSISIALERSDDNLDIFIYDNSIVSQCSEYRFAYKRLNITYVHDPLNPGVSKAYNCGALFFNNYSIKKRFLLLLDQDTSFSTDIFEEYRRAVLRNSGIKLFAPVLKLSSGVFFSPCLYWFRRGFPLKTISHGVQNLSGKSVVNSGILVSLQAFRECGGYNEDIPLDFSDFQFIERFKKHHKTFYQLDSTGFQNFSNNETDISKLAHRFKYFCIGTLMFERESVFDHFVFFLLSLQRATTLSIRTKNLVFYKVFYNTYLKGN